VALSFNVVAQRLGHPSSSLSRWVRQARIDSGQRGPRDSGLLNSEVRDECQATSGIDPPATPGGLDRPGLPLAADRGLERQPQPGATPLARGRCFETPATRTNTPTTPMPCRSGAQAVCPARPTSSQDYPGKSIRGVVQRPVQEARLLAGSTESSPIPTDRIRRSGGYVPGGPPAMEGGLITPSALIETGPLMGSRHQYESSYGNFLRFLIAISGCRRAPSS
jgi:hypothetical protein